MTKSAPLIGLPKWLITLAILVAFSFGGYVLSKMIQPQRHAEVLNCLERQADGSRKNTCDTPIVAAYCLREGQSLKPTDTCAFGTLESGEAFDNYLPASIVGAPYWMACTAPYRPKQIPTVRNSAIFEKGCATPDAT